jgi:DNA-binding NtrC family response regulator
MSVRILLADDDAALRRVIQFKLKQKGYAVTVAEDGLKALDAIKRGRYDLLLSDMKMPGLSGLELLERAKAAQPDLDIILITAFADISQAVQAVKLGASDYLTKPFEDDQLFVAIDKSLKLKKLQDENKYLRGQLQGRDFFKGIVGVSRPFKELMALVDKTAPTDATILITGESGTGKEVVARAIHLKSLRSDRDFVTVNCAAIPRDLIESELFGHVRGAFTGAVRDKKGKFELADQGTLFLDEISELNVELQAKLLRAIQERVIEPVGAERGVEVDVRLLAATNIDLKERVAAGKFREDLFYRLNVIPVHVPSLRERPEDIPILTSAFLQKFGQGADLSITSDLQERLKRYFWPGNIRELENLIERLAILRKTDVLTVSDLPSDFGAGFPGPVDANPERSSGGMTFHEAEKKLIVDALNRFGWNRTKAAAHLNIPRHVLVYRMKKYDITESRPSA